VGTFLGGVTLTLGKALALLGVLVAGSITFCALGLAFGFFAGPNSAAPIVNLVYLPMAFLSGLWVPIMFLPKPVQTLALWLPPYHFSQLALHVIGASRGESVPVHIGAMVAGAVVFGAIAYLGYRRDEGKTYG
jgi:ABC-2 type transport system permease protein